MATPKKDANPKKARSKKIKPAKKEPTKTNKTQAVHFSWEQWSAVFEKAFTCWRQVFFKYVLVIICTLALQILGIFTLSAVLLTVFGGLSGLENILANARFGTLPNAFLLTTSLLGVLLWIVYTIYISILSKIAFLSIIKAQSNNQTVSVFKALFAEGNRFLWRYIGLSLRVFFYIAWPILLLVAGFIAWDISLVLSGNETWLPPSWSLGVLLGIILLVILAFACVLYAAIRVLFAMPLLIQSDLSVSQTFKKAQSITHKAWWFAFLMWGLFVILLYALNVIMAQLAYYDPIILMEATNEAESLRLTDLLAFFVSLLIFGPITTAFQYYLMLQTADNQSVKI